MRCGARALLLLAAPLNCQILRALEEGPKQQTDLRRETGQPAQTTLRAQLKKLDEVNAITRTRRDSFPGVLDYELSPSGRCLLEVMRSLEAWLSRHPDGPLELGEPPAKAATKALAEGWSTSMLRALAPRPLTLTELDRVISSHSYPSLERRLSAMRLAGQVEVRNGDGRGTPYGVTEWTRRAIGPLIAASQWERNHIPVESPRMGKIDIETIFLLVTPLLHLPTDLAGSVRMAVQTSTSGPPEFSGAMIEVGDGRVVSCRTRLEGHPEAWASGNLPAWLAALASGDLSQLELGGDGTLCLTLLEEMHGALFGGSPARTSP